MEILIIIFRDINNKNILDMINKETTFILLKASEKITNSKADKTIKELDVCCKDVSKLIQKISAEDVFYIGKCDELERLKRNATALHLLLSQAADAVVYIKSGIHEILEADRNCDEEEKRKKKIAMEKAIASERKAEYNRKQRHPEE